MHSSRGIPSSSSAGRTGTALATLTVLAFATAAPPAGAAITPSVVAGTGVVKLVGDDADDTIVPVCVGGQLRTQGDATDLLPCAAVTQLEVRGNNGADTIDLRAVTREAFPMIARIVGNEGSGGGLLEGSPLDDLLTGNEGIARGNGGDDVIQFVTTAQGGAGDDVIDGAENADGGEGADVIIGAGTSEGGPADDLLVTPNGPVSGGEGADIVQLGTPNDAIDAVTLTLRDDGFTVDVPAFDVSETRAAVGVETYNVSLPAGNQTIDASAFSGSLVADMGAGDDTVLGTGQADTLFGSLGADRIVGGGGADTVDGGGGNDDIAVRDGVADTVRCGAGVDTLQGDREDLLTACETIDVPAATDATAVPVPPAAPAPTGGPAGPAVPVAAADVLAPRPTLSGARRVGRRLSVVASCPATEARCVVVAGLRAAGRRGRRTVGIDAGTAVAVIPGGATRALSRTLTVAQSRTLARLARPRLTVRTTTVDAAGNTATGSRTLSITTAR